MNRRVDVSVSHEDYRIQQNSQALADFVGAPVRKAEETYELFESDIARNAVCAVCVRPTSGSGANEHASA